MPQGVERAEDFIGLHFFSPADKMPLLEIIAGERTSDATLAKAFDLARQIRKTPIVVNDSMGFFTSRVIATFLDEAVAMLGEGVDPQTIEQATTQAGYPVAALALMDEITLTLMRKIRLEARRATGDADAVLDLAPRRERHRPDGRRVRPAGQVLGPGVLRVRRRQARRGLWPGLREHFGTAATPPEGSANLRELQERMMFIESLETIRCFDEGVLRSVAEANIGSIMGIGFPPWTGGVVQYISQYDGGPAGFVARARELAASHGDRFLPPDSLVAASAEGKVLPSERS